MSKAASEELHRLCSDYYHGLLPRDLYRQRRAAIVDAAVAGEEFGCVEPTKPSAVRPGPSAPESMPESVAVHQDMGRRSVAPIALSVILLLAGAGAALVLIWPGSENRDDLRVTSDSPAAADLMASADQDFTHFVAEFVAADEWSVRSVSDFLFDWDDLALDEQDIVVDTEIFRSFGQRLQEQIKVLSALGQDAEAARLAAFGMELGLSVDWAGAGHVESRPTSELSSADAPALIATDTAPDMESLDSSSEVITVSVDSSAADSHAPDAVSQPAQVEPEPAAPAVVRQPLAAPQPKAPAQPVRETITATPVVVPEPQRVTPLPVPAKTAVSSSPAPGTLKSDRACSADLLSTRRRSCWDFVAVDVPGPKMVVIKPGTFVMGSDDDPVASPPVDVTIAYPFAISSREISTGEYRLFCKLTERSCASVFDRGDEFPVAGVTWEEANAYANWLTERTGHVYRLPSEAEWEYCARAGSSTRYPFGDELYPGDAVFSAGRNLDAPVPRNDRTTERNGFNLWHMIGNLREWVADTWREGLDTAPSDGSARVGAGTMRVVRGGSFRDGAERLTSAAREGLDTQHSDDATGFRLVLELAAR